MVQKNAEQRTPSLYCTMSKAIAYRSVSRKCRCLTVQKWGAETGNIFDFLTITSKFETRGYYVR